MKWFSLSIVPWHGTIINKARWLMEWLLEFQEMCAYLGKEENEDESKCS